MTSLQKRSWLPQTLAVALAVLASAVLALAQGSLTLYATGNFGTKLFIVDLTSQSVIEVGSTGQVQGFSLAFSPAGNAYTLVN